MSDNVLPDYCGFRYLSDEELKAIEFDYFVSNSTKPSFKDLDTDKETYWFNAGLGMVYRLKQITAKKAKILGEYYAIPAVSKPSHTKFWCWVYDPDARKLVIDADTGAICGELSDKAEGLEESTFDEFLSIFEE